MSRTPEVSALRSAALDPEGPDDFRYLMSKDTDLGWAYLLERLNAAGWYLVRTEIAEPDEYEEERIRAVHDERHRLLLHGVLDEVCIVLATLDAEREKVGRLADMIAGAYCFKGRFETCGDPFCSDARKLRNDILGGS